LLKNREKEMNICVIGLGYIGLPTAAFLANRGHRIFGVDINSDAVTTINDGRIHIVEPDLDTFVRAAVESGKFTADTKPQSADVFIIAVPTPFGEDHSPDLAFVESATKALAPHVKPGNLVILESTSPVGTTEMVAKWLEDEGAPVDSVFIAHCPERVLPGRVMIELTENDRIVGGITEESTRRVADFYRSFVTGKVLETDARTAEMSKLVENASRDVQIAFANELSILADRFGINVWELIELANHHPRVNILQPGTGVGGHCIAVDPWFIVHSAGGDAKLIETARRRNTSKTEWVIEKIEARAKDFLDNYGRPAKIAAMGLAFKPNIDDLRESPSLYVARRLKADGFEVVAVEPNIKSHDEFELWSIEQAISEADLIVYLVAHTPFFDQPADRHKTMDFCGVVKS
jgi:UDP-N-acetyl-D-mannosaminuronic acid dehydrogenase